MPGLLRTHPLLATAALAGAVVVASALLVLPRLDALEIAGTRDLDAPRGGRRLEVRVRYRLTDAAGGALRLRAAQPAGLEARARVELAAGSGTAVAAIDLPSRDRGVLLAELVPAGPPSLLEPLLRGRRRAAAAFAASPPP